MCAKLIYDSQAGCGPTRVHLQLEAGHIIRGWVYRGSCFICGTCMPARFFYLPARLHSSPVKGEWSRASVMIPLGGGGGGGGGGRLLWDPGGGVAFVMIPTGECIRYDIHWGLSASVMIPTWSAYVMISVGAECVCYDTHRGVHLLWYLHGVHLL